LFGIIKLRSKNPAGLDDATVYPACRQPAVSAQNHNARKPTIRGRRNFVPILAPIETDGVGQPELVDAEKSSDS
jgi:hypothetical protein